MFCPSCGFKNPEDVRFCLSCGASFPSAAPAEPIVPPSPAPVKPAVSAPPSPSAAAAAASAENTVAGYRVASLGDRFIALILDTILLAAAFAVVGMWTAVRWGGVTASGFEMTGKPALIAIATVMIFGFLYYWLFEGLLRATLGKGIVGIAVTDENGRRCGLARSLIRNILRIIDGLFVYLLGFLVALFSKKRQRLGDHLAHTFVVERGAGTLGRVVLVLLWFALLAGGIWGAVVIHRGVPVTTTTTTVTSTVSTTSTTAISGGETVPTEPILTSGDLKLTDFAFLQAEDGPPRATAPYKPRERVHAAFKIAGFTTDSQGRVDLDYGVETADPNGLAIYNVKKDLHGTPGTSKTAAVSIWFDIPLFAPPGTYRVRVMAHDNVKKTDGELIAPITVEAPPPVTSTQLEIRDLHFSLSEDGPPLDPAVIQPGTTLYVEGKLAGMQFREDRIDVGIAFQVFDPSGEKVLDRPDFLAIRDSFQYHPPTFYVPITAHLNLPSGVSKGTYREKYVVTDRIDGTSTTYELKFEVR